MSRFVVTGAGFIWLSGYCLTALAEEARPVVSPIATLGKLVVALFVVLAVFWLFAKGMRHLQVGQAGSNNNLKVISALSVGQRERVVVVQAGDDQLVLGVTSSQINTLHVLKEPLQETSSQEISDFREKLKSAMSRQAVKT